MNVMRLSSKEAYDLLMEANKLDNSGYVKHSEKVAEAAYRIARALEIDADYAKALGYIHDIGKRFGPPYSEHIVKGYEYLLSIGVDKEMATICLTHSYLNNDINCTGGKLSSPDDYKYEFRKDFIKNHKYTIYDKIICFCDLMCRKDFMILEERLVEIMVRKGINKNTIYHIKEALKLKWEIENMLKCSVYKMFPEIKERLFADDKE